MTRKCWTQLISYVYEFRSTNSRNILEMCFWNKWVPNSVFPLFAIYCHSQAGCFIIWVFFLCCLLVWDVSVCLVVAVCLFKEVSLGPCLTCFTIGKEHPLFTYSRAPGLCSSNNLSQVIVSEPWDTWQANKGHTPPWNIYEKRTCSVNLPLHTHPRNGTWLPLTGCRAMTIAHPISLLAYNHFKATPELM